LPPLTYYTPRRLFYYFRSWRPIGPARYCSPSTTTQITLSFTPLYKISHSIARNKPNPVQLTLHMVWSVRVNPTQNFPPSFAQTLGSSTLTNFVAAAGVVLPLREFYSRILLVNCEFSITRKYQDYHSQRGSERAKAPLRVLPMW